MQTTSTEPAIGISGARLPAELSQWADLLAQVAGDLSSVGEGSPEQQADRCRERLSRLEDQRDDLARAPDAELKELQEPFVERLTELYRNCTSNGSSEESARLLQAIADLRSKIDARLRKLDVPARSG